MYKLIRFFGVLTFFVTVMAFSKGLKAKTNSDALSHHVLALHWAPEIYQATHPFHPRADWITRFDFDGDFDAWNNWDNLDKYRLPASVYYHVTETQSHWFIYYGVFHPRDWEPGFDNGIVSHENDLEDMLFVVRKTPQPLGQLELIETQSHSDFLAYSHQKLIPKHMFQAGGLKFESHRPKVLVPVGGHGIVHFTQLPAEYVHYTPGLKSEEPSLNKSKVLYSLISLDDLWKKRYDFGPGQPFVSFGVFGADDHTWINSAVAPWQHDDPNDGPVVSGDILSDPAYMLNQHFKLSLPYSFEYISPPLHTHQIKVPDISLIWPLRSDEQLVFQVKVENKLYWQVSYQSRNQKEFRVGSRKQQIRYLSVPPGSKLTLRWIRQSKGILSAEHLIFETQNPLYSTEKGLMKTLPFKILKEVS